MEGSFQKYQQRFDADGLSLAEPPDSPLPRRYPILINARQVIRGTFRSRPGLNALVTAPANKTPWHSIRRLSDKPTADFTYVSGIGTELFTGKDTASTASRKAGFSSNPLCFVPFRPDQGIADWMAVADINQMCKVRLDGTVHDLGISPPATAPQVGLDISWGTQRLEVDDGSHAASWGAAPGGTTSQPRPNAQCQPVNSFWGQGFDYTGGITGGWISIEVQPGPPSGLVGIGPGTVLVDSGGVHTYLVEEVLPATPTATTVKQVLQDASGQFFTLVPTTAYTQFAQHAIVKIGTHYGVISAVIIGPDGSYALRIYMNSGTPLVGDTINAQPTLFAYSYFGSYPPGGAFTSLSTKFATIPASAVTALARTGLALNLTAFPVSGKPVDILSDELHISLFCTNWKYVDEIKIAADVDDGSFTRNYYSRTVRQNELLLAQNNNLSAVDSRALETRQQLLDRLTTLQRNQAILESNPADDPISARINQGMLARLDNQIQKIQQQLGDTGPAVDTPGGSSSLGSSGANQWAEIRFKLSDWQRYGEDKSLDLQKVNSLQLSITTNSGGAADVWFNSWWIGGGSPPDVSQNAPYEYRYRYRASATGARSDYSPPSRELVWPHRTSTYVSCDGSTATGADKIDIQRRGGTVNDWVLISTIDNQSGAPVIFTDQYDDDYALGAAEDPFATEGNVNAKPFPVIRAPFTYSNAGTVLAGTMLKAGSAVFDTSWLGGTAISVNGIATLIYRVHSTSLCELYTNVGSGTGIGIRVDIPEPVTTAPLPVIFGPIEGWYFGLGDKYNPGRLYAFNQNTLDSTRGSYYVDITDPGDPLQNGCVFAGRAYLWSANRMISMTIDPSAPGAPVRFDDISGGQGLYARYALAVGDAMYWLGRDGIYASSGGDCVNITRRDLQPLFPNESVPGVSTNGIDAPALTTANANLLRLSYCFDRYLYFDYVNAGGQRRTLALDRSSQDQGQWGWWYDTYANGALFHYGDEGENVRAILVGGNAATSKLYTVGPNTLSSVATDDGTAFACQVRSFAVDGGARAEGQIIPSLSAADVQKLYGDVVVDIDPGNASITPRILFDNFSSTTVASAITGSGRAQTRIDLNSGAGQYAKNIAIDFQWSISADNMSPQLYLWSFSSMQRPEDTIKRATDYSDLGFWGPKEIRGCDIECDTSNVTRAVAFDYTRDDGSVGVVTVNITAPEKTIVPVAFIPPLVGYEIRIHPSDTNTWKLYEVTKWHFDPLADLNRLIGAWDEFDGLRFVQGVEIYGDTNGIDVPVDVQKDFAAVAFTIPAANHPGRGWRSYAFEPFLAYQCRLAPQSSMRVMKARFISEPEAPLGTIWESQEIELGLPLGFARQIEIEYASTTAVTFLWYVDRVLQLTDTTSLPATGSLTVWSKVQVALPAVKGSLGKPRLQSTSEFRVRQRGTVLVHKDWAGAFNRKEVLGGLHREIGARV